MRILVVSNHKGGTGKTTTVHTLGHIFASEHGLNVVMIDLDPQASLTLACGISEEDAHEANIAHVLRDSGGSRITVDKVLRKLDDRLWLAPAHSGMLGAAQMELTIMTVGRDFVLRDALESLRGADMVLIDTMPGINILLVNALVAATDVLVPTQPQVLALGGLGKFLDTLRQIERVNPGLNRLGILLTFYRDRYRLHRAAREGLEQSDIQEGFRLFETRIGQSVKVAEAPGEGETVIEHAPDNDRAREYRALAQEVLERMGL